MSFRVREFYVSEKPQKLPHALVIPKFLPLDISPWGFCQEECSVADSHTADLWV